jgi:hypothetical protein
VTAPAPEPTVEQRLASLEMYMADLRYSFHILTHSFVLATMPASATICQVCDQKLTGPPGAIL